jgi:hypothetical protein
MLCNFVDGYQRFSSVQIEVLMVNMTVAVFCVTSKKTANLLKNFVIFYGVYFCRSIEFQFYEMAIAGNSMSEFFVTISLLVMLFT